MGGVVQTLDNSTITNVRVRISSSFLISLACLIALLYFGRVLIVTLLISILSAFILDPLVGLFGRMKIPRGLASFLVCSLALLGIYLSLFGAYMQVSVLMEELPAYTQRINELSDKVLMEVESAERSVYQVVVPKRIRDQEQRGAVPPQTAASRKRGAVPTPTGPPPVQEVRIKAERSPVVEYLYAHFQEFYTILLMGSFVPFLVYFMLSWRDHFLKNLVRLFRGESRDLALRAMEDIAHVARAYVVGNFILGVLLAIASSLFFWIAKIPYWPLVGPLSGFLSLAPYIGLPLALIPPVLAALTVFNNLTAYLVIGTTVAFLHLLALNLMYPKLVGARVHLNPIAVTVSLMFWGTIWGGIGLLLAVPITAAVKAVLDNVPSMAPYGRLLGD